MNSETQVIPQNDFSEIESFLWRQLEQALTESGHGWKLPILGSTSATGSELRIVVLRNVDAASHSFLVHTDWRSPKIEQLRNDASATWLFYDSRIQIQLRIKSKVSLHFDDDIADREWNAARLSSRRCYLAPAAPGASASTRSVNLPDELTTRLPTEQEVTAGRKHFAVIRSQVLAIDWLLLKRDGNLRAEFVYAEDGGLNSRWLEP